MPATKNPFSAIFVSPHLDDAVLSATHALITELARPNAKVLCLTLFTNIDKPPYSPDALKFCRDSDAPNPAELFIQRRKEDSLVMQQLGCELEHWAHSDAGFRQAQTTHTPLYTTFDQIFSGKILMQDRSLITDLTAQLSQFQSEKTTATTHWYAPLGVGNHVDHLITYLAVLQLAIAKKLSAQNLHFWLDVPYHHNPTAYFNRLSTITNTNPAVKLLPWQHHWLTPTQSTLKQELVRGYKSQWAGLVHPGGYDSLDDHYERSIQLLPL